MRLQRPANNLAAECVQDDSEIAELLRQMHVGDVSHPELIEAGEHYTAGKIGNDAPAVTRVRRCRHKRGPAQAQKVVRAHQAQHPLVIGLPAFTSQESPDPSVAVVAMLERQALNGVSQSGLFLGGAPQSGAERVVEWLQGPLLELDVAEIVVHEADEPNVVVDLLNAKRLTGERG